ncbi:hypothetical protein D3C71_942960 [compost metagenome]
MDVSLPLPSMLIAMIAIWIAYKNYLRKGGLDIRGSYSLTASVECSEKYISEILIENAKDRSVTIFAIYLQVGRSHYLQLIDFESSPLILRAFESFKKEFGPVECYSSNFSRYSVNRMLADKKVKKRLVCSTSSGRYVVPRFIPKWTPFVASISNALVRGIYPSRSEFEGRAVGDQVDYIAKFTSVAGDVRRVVLLQKSSYRYQIFEGVQLTPESLMTSDALSLFLEGARKNGAFGDLKIEITDAGAWRGFKHSQFGLFDRDAIELRQPSVWEFYVLGNFYARWRRLRVRKAFAKKHVSLPSGDSADT